MSALLSVALTPKLIAPLPGKMMYYITKNVLFQMCFFPSHWWIVGMWDVHLQKAGKNLFYESNMSNIPHLLLNYRAFPVVCTVV